MRITTQSGGLAVAFLSAWVALIACTSQQRAKVAQNKQELVHRINNRGRKDHKKMAKAYWLIKSVKVPLSPTAGTAHLFTNFVGYVCQPANLRATPVYSLILALLKRNRKLSWESAQSILNGHESWKAWKWILLSSCKSLAASKAREAKAKMTLFQIKSRQSWKNELTNQGTWRKY